MNSFFPIFKTVLHGRSAGKILLATLVSFTFSITVILCTFGLMDGFDYLLKSGLRHSSGDILITSSRGFFNMKDGVEEAVKTQAYEAYSGYIQTEAFVLSGGQSRGVLVKGIEPETFNDVTGLSVTLRQDSVSIGKQLARELDLKIGDFLALTLAKGNDTSGALPLVRQFRVSSIVEHGIYQKNLRFVYVNRGELSFLLGSSDKVNGVVISIQPAHQTLNDLDEVRSFQLKLRHKLPSDYFVKPFWSEYQYLIEAVKEEKFLISLILQMIVVVAVFNIVAFVIYIMEKKAQDFFFLRAVGLSLKDLSSFWFLLIIIIWFLSCVGAWLLSQVFNWSLGNLAIFQIPGEIYVLSSLQIKLGFKAYATVFILSLLWVLLAAGIGYWRMRRRPIIQGLRQEFN